MAEVVRSTVSIRRRQRRIRNSEEQTNETKDFGQTNLSESSSEDGEAVKTDMNHSSLIEGESSQSNPLRTSRRGRLAELSSRYADESIDSFVNDAAHEIEKNEEVGEGDDDDDDGSVKNGGSEIDDNDYNYDDDINDDGMQLGDEKQDILDIGSVDMEPVTMDLDPTDVNAVGMDKLSDIEDSEDAKSVSSSSSSVDDEETREEKITDSKIEIKESSTVVTRVSHSKQYKLCYEVCDKASFFPLFMEC